MGSYHRHCYQTYTHRKTLQRIASRHLGASQDPDASKSSDSENSDTRDDEEMSRACSRKTRNKVARTNMAACLFCGQQRQKRHHGKSEPLSDCMTLQAAMVIKEAATVRGDDRIVREMSGPDAIAAEAARYHRSCYAAFTDTRAIKKLLENHITDEDGQEEGDSPYRHAFQHIQTESEVQREIVDNALSAAAVKMSDLRNRYVERKAWMYLTIVPLI